jgi:hypothetical protein
MSKRDKRHGHRPAGSTPATLEELRVRVESLIAGGRARDALDVAKQFVKGAPGAEGQALVLTAYEARVRELLAQGLHDDASALAAVVGERFPAHGARIASLVSQTKAIAAGDLRSVVAEIAKAPPPRRRELEAVLMRELSDPRQLAEAPGLPADDPLRVGARAVALLFVAVTSGPLPAGSLAALDVIPRSSPLAPWKLAIRALDAYYRRADAAALANLDAIPPDSAPARLVPALRHLIGEAGAAEPRSAAAAFLKSVGGERTLLRSPLQQLARALDERDAPGAAVAVERVMALLEPGPPALLRSFVATAISRWLRLELMPRPLLEMLRRRRGPAWRREVERLVALALERAGEWDAAVNAWDGYLTAAIRAGDLPATGPAPSRVLLHMAELFPADLDAVLDAFDVDSEEEIELLVESGELAEYADRGRLLARARDADPDPRVFRALVAHWEARDPQRADAEAEAWRARHPSDLEPLLHLVRAAERRGAERQALELLDQAEALNRMHPEVRQSRFRLLLGSAEERVREGRFALALADLDRLEKEAVAGGDTWVYLCALRCVATRRNGDGPAAVRLYDEMRARLGNPTMLALVESTVAHTFGLEPPVLPEAPPAAEAVPALARAGDLFRGLGRRLTVAPELAARIEGDLTGAAPADLYSLCAVGLDIGRLSLTYAASGEGLATDGPLLHRFLLARGRLLSLADARRDRERALLCLRAARDLAGRARDQAAMREASAGITALGRPREDQPWRRSAIEIEDEPLAAADIARVVAAERASRQAPGFVMGSAKRKRRQGPRRRPLQQDLFDDVLPFMEKHP